MATAPLVASNGVVRVDAELGQGNAVGQVTMGVLELGEITEEQDLDRNLKKNAIPASVDAVTAGM